jgi:imidazolonepropionase-like amidohydrolase
MTMMRTVSLIALFWLPFAGAPDHAQPNPTLIRDVRVFDGERAIEHRSVLIAGGTIRRIGGPRMKAQNAEIVDGRNRTLLPGLFDAHVHVPANPEPALRQLASFGVTTALDMFDGEVTLRAKQRIESEDPTDVADLRASGLGAVAPGSTLAMMMRQPLPTVSAPEQAEAWVTARLAEGSDYVKIIYDPREGGPLSLDTVTALVQAAHARGKLVVVHALDEQKAREAIGAGADGLAHLFLGDSPGADFGQFAATHHVFVVPTLITLYGLCGNPQGSALLEDPLLGPRIPADQRQDSIKQPDPSRQHLCGAIRPTLHQLVEAGVPILAGTDAGIATGKLLGVVAYGATLHVELKLLVDEGLTPVQALTAATSAAARGFRFNDRGKLRPGLRADLLLVDGDPTRDIMATRRIVEVWKRGVPIPRERAE